MSEIQKIESVIETDADKAWKWFATIRHEISDDAVKIFHEIFGDKKSPESLTPETQAVTGYIAEGESQTFSTISAETSTIERMV